MYTYTFCTYTRINNKYKYIFVCVSIYTYALWYRFNKNEKHPLWSNIICTQNSENIFGRKKKKKRKRVNAKFCTYRYVEISQFFFQSLFFFFFFDKLPQRTGWFVCNEKTRAARVCGGCNYLRMGSTWVLSGYRYWHIYIDVYAVRAGTYITRAAIKQPKSNCNGIKGAADVDVDQWRRGRADRTERGFRDKNVSKAAFETGIWQRSLALAVRIYTLRERAHTRRRVYYIYYKTRGAVAVLNGRLAECDNAEMNCSTAVSLVRTQ